MALCTTLQIIGQKHAPETDAAVIMSLETVSAALLGWIFLDELLSLPQLFGGGLMLAGMLVAQLGALRPLPDKRQQVVNSA